MSHKSVPPAVSTIGIDLGKNSFHLVGLDQRGATCVQDGLPRSTNVKHSRNNIALCPVFTGQTVTKPPGLPLASAQTDQSSAVSGSARLRSLKQSSSEYADVA